jgi:hypothetical protein
MPRKIVEVKSNVWGLISITNDGKAFYLLDVAGPDSAGPLYRDGWKELPAIPQDDYEKPRNEEMEETVALIKKTMADMIAQFQGAGLVGHHHGVPAYVPDQRKCPIEGCNFEAADLGALTAHMSKEHRD